MSEFALIHPRLLPHLQQLLGEKRSNKREDSDGVCESSQTNPAPNKHKKTENSDTSPTSWGANPAFHPLSQLVGSSKSDTLKALLNSCNAFKSSALCSLAVSFAGSAALFCS